MAPTDYHRYTNRLAVTLFTCIIQNTRSKARPTTLIVILPSLGTEEGRESMLFTFMVA
jgi:hypothetical protein